MSIAPKTEASLATLGDLSNADLRGFEEIAQLAHSRAGLVLSSDKAPMVLARVGKRIRALGVPNLSEYCDHIRGPGSEAERRELISILTTNVTSFMREEHHFQMVETSIVPEIESTLQCGGAVRLWSAGCSSGQEPYSLAMTLVDKIPNVHTQDVRILATDIDPNILSKARLGEYTEQQLSGLPKNYRDRFFQDAHSEASAQSSFRIDDKVKKLVSFKELNLLAEWPMKRSFHLIFCRNVVIYFDRETQNNLWKRFSEILNPGGYLFLGHSERLDTTDFRQFRTVGTTAYQLTSRPH